ncbi:MAG: acetyl-CoA carboxylase biotin carboxyl carrier protein [Acidobacteriota bacterium]
MTINIDQLKQILDLFQDHGLSEFELENDGLRIRLRKDARGGPIAPDSVPPPQPLSAAAGAAAGGGERGASGFPPAAAGRDEADVGLVVVASPIVGTFYRSPEPGAPSFVEPGSTVRKGDVLCIIEAMKLMNEIDSEYDGEVVSVFVESGQPVQYGERLFAIRIK